MLVGSATQAILGRSVPSMSCAGPAATQAHWDSYPNTTASQPRCKRYLGDLRPRPTMKPTSAGIKDETSHLLVTRLDWFVESRCFKSERGIVLHPRTILLIFLYFTPCLTFSLRLMVTHRLDSCDHLLYRLVTRYVLMSLLLS